MCWCGWRYFAEEEVNVRSCPSRVVIIKEIGVCKFIVRSREYGEMEGSDMILVQGPSCLFSAVIEKPFFPSSRQVTKSRHDEHVSCHTSLPNILGLDNISIIHRSAMKTPCPQEPNATGKGQYRWRGASK